MNDARLIDDLGLAVEVARRATARAGRLKTKVSKRSLTAARCVLSELEFTPSTWTSLDSKAVTRTILLILAIRAMLYLTSVRLNSS